MVRAGESDQLIGQGSAHPDTVADIYHRFAPRVLALARRYVDRHTRGKYDPEDVLQSVCQSVVSGLRLGQIVIRDDALLWSLLARMTVHKCLNRRAYYRMERRNVLREVPIGCVTLRDPAVVAARDPTPSAAASREEALRQVTVGLAERDREIVQFYLDGYSVREISQRTGRAERTVRRVLARIKQRFAPAVDWVP